MSNKLMLSASGVSVSVIAPEALAPRLPRKRRAERPNNGRVWSQASSTGASTSWRGPSFGPGGLLGIPAAVPGNARPGGGRSAARRGLDKGLCRLPEADHGVSDQKPPSESAPAPSSPRSTKLGAHRTIIKRGLPEGVGTETVRNILKAFRAQSASLYPRTATLLLPARLNLASFRPSTSASLCSLRRVSKSKAKGTSDR